jgi:hypothetical protein
MSPKGIYERTPENTRGPREYPADVVELVCSLYESGMTVREVAAAAPKGYKVQNILERHLSARRTTARRDQRLEANHSWKGDDASYKALHLRVAEYRGKPSLCSRCGATEGRFEWANLTGDYADINDYERMCVSCHRRFDAARRRATGQPTSPPRKR